MNGDFGASLEDEAYEESSGQSSAVNSPAAKWFAPAKQPLRSDSGKHWSKSRRGELGVSSPTPGDQTLVEEMAGKGPTVAANPGKIQPGSGDKTQQPRKLSTDEQTDYNTAQNSMSALNLHGAASPVTVSNSGERRPSLPVGKERTDQQQQSTPPRAQTNPGENPMRRPSVAKDQNHQQQQQAQAAQQSTPQRPAPTVSSGSSQPPPAQRASQEQPLTNNAPTGTSPTKSALANSNSAVLSMSNLYEKPVSYKYLPLELASAAPVKNSIARNILFQSLGHGLLVIKHGRKGGPKKRVLYCDYGVTKLFWTDSVLDPEEVHKHGIDSMIDPARTVHIKDILEVRAGVDLDPETTTAALRTAARTGVPEAVMMLAKREANGTADSGKDGKSEKRSLVKSLFGGGGLEKDGELLYGTAVLRKKVKPEELSKCLSLITAERSYDFQSFSKKDYNLLYINLKEIVTKMRNSTVLPAEVAPIVNEYRETLSAKKSVRFMMEGEDAEQKADSSPVLEAISPDRESLSLSGASGDVLHLNSVTDIDALLAPGISGKSRVKTSESGRHGRRFMSEDSDSGHDPNTFSDVRGDMNRTISSLSGLTGMSLAQATDTTVSSGGSLEDHHDSGQGQGHRAAPGAALAALTSASSGANSPNPSPRADNPYRMKAHEALQIGLLLAQQEQDFGTNMYQSLTPEDEPEIEHLNALGYSTEEAILKIFQKKYQPEPGDKEEMTIAPSRSQDAGFDYTDQFDPASSWFKGSTKGFGRQSSFFPPVFQPDTVPEEGSDSESKLSSQVTESAKRRDDKAQKAAEAQDWIDAIPPPAPAKGTATKATKVPLNPAVLESLPQPRQPLPGPPQTPKLPPPPSYEESAKHPTVSTGGNSERSASDLISSANSSVKSSVSSNDSPPTSARGRQSALSAPQDARQREMMYRPPETPDASPMRGVAEPILRMSSCDALQIGLLLSQQEAEFGTNMYDSLENSDEPAIRRLVAQGYTNDEAVLEIFNTKFGKAGPRTARSHVLPAAAPASRLQPPPAPQPVPPPAPMPVPQPYSYQYSQMGQAPAPYGYAPAPMPGPYGHPQAPMIPPMDPYQQQLPPGAMHQSMYGMPVPPAQPPMMPMPAPYATPGPGPRPPMYRTNSLAQSSFFPNDPHTMQAPYHPAAPAGGLPLHPPAPPQAGGNWGAGTGNGLSPRSTTRSNMLSTLSDEEAVQMALLLSQQEAEFGVNMYDALRPQDEPELRALIASGYTNEQAVLCLFERRYPPRGGPLPQQQLPSRDSSWNRPDMQQQYSGGMYPSPGAVPTPRMPPQRQASMVPQQGPMRMQSSYNMNSPPPMPAPAPMPQEAVPVVVTAIPLAIDDANEVQAHAQRAGGAAVVPVPVPAAIPAAAPAPAPQRGLNRQGSTMSVASTAAPAPVPPRGLARHGSTMSPAAPGPGPAPAPQRGLNRQGSTMSVTSSDPAPSGGRPQLTKKRSIFNFTVGGGGRAADEIAPEKKLKFKEADVKAITNMGYTREQAIWALLQNNNNVPMAIDALCRS